ncbi:MAG: restriction endonuclease subunit S [Sulfuritalea sp.]|nr:restriction endonuclease subunit S [Sulfuritalea sp.]
MSATQPRSELVAHAAWPVDRIKDHAGKIGSGVTPSGGAASYLDDGIPLLRSQNVHFDGLRLDDVAYIAEETHNEMSGSKLRPRDVLLNITGASIGRCAFVPDDFGEGNVNQHVCIIRPAARLNHKFLTYCLSAPWGQDQVFAGFTGASRQGLGQRDLGEIQVPLPPVPEQQRIAAYLDAGCAAIDAAVAAKRRQLETLDALRKSIVYRAVTKGLNPTAPSRTSGVAWFGEIPQHWRCEHLKRFSKRIQAGMTPPTNTPEYYFDGTIPWFAPGSFNGDIDLREPRKLINELARSEGELRIFPAETVFVIGIGATIGKVGLVSAEASCNQQLIGIVCGHRMHSRFLAYQFKIYEDVIPGIATATTLPIFDQVKTGNLPTLQPPIDEQRSICAFLDAKLAESKNIVACIERQIATLTAYRKSLIHECVTGQRRITETEVRHTIGRIAKTTGAGQREDIHA